MLKKRNKVLILAVLLTGSMLLMTSCVTETKVVTKVIHELPDAEFPVFPDPEPVTLDEATETVSMPLWYYTKIAEYKADVDKIEALFENLRELNEKENAQ